MALQTPGAFFIGTLVPSEKKFIKSILVSAKKNGYNRVVEPCAGAFAMSYLALESGFKAENIEASDITLFSSIYGNAVMEKSIEEYELKASGFSEEELRDPATALYSLIYFKTLVTATNEMSFAIVKDIELNRELHIKTIQEYIDNARKSLKGFNYRALDMYAHLEEVLNDPAAIVIMNPPTYKAGYEKWFNFKDLVTWKEPEYKIFDPVEGLPDLMNNICKDAKALCMCYEDNKPGLYSGHPVFARYGVRSGYNVYLTTNRPDEAIKLSGGKRIFRSEEKDIGPLECSIIPEDYVLTSKSKVSIDKIDDSAAFYYRSIWTHNFAGSKCQLNCALMIDGMVAGVLGFQTAIGKRLNDVLLVYGIKRPHKTLRLGRLLVMLAMNKSTLLKFIPEHTLNEFNGISTISMTKHPESKELRGLMKLKTKKKGKLGYKLVYWSKITEKSYKQIVIEFLSKEEKWQKEKSKNKK